MVLEHVEKWFGALHVLRDVSMAVAERERVVVCGPSGSGIDVAPLHQRLESYQRGVILVAGSRSIRRNPRSARCGREVSMVFQRFNLFPHRTALETSFDAGRVRKQPREAGARAGGRC